MPSKGALYKALAIVLLAIGALLAIGLLAYHAIKVFLALMVLGVLGFIVVMIADDIDYTNKTGSWEDEDERNKHSGL